MFKTVCSEGVCKKAKVSLYLCKRMDKKTGIFEYEDIDFLDLLPWKCHYIKKTVYWTRYGLEHVMKEIIKKYEEK